MFLPQISSFHEPHTTNHYTTPQPLFGWDASFRPENIGSRLPHMWDACSLSPFSIRYKKTSQLKLWRKLLCYLEISFSSRNNLQFNQEGYLGRDGCENCGDISVDALCMRVNRSASFVLSTSDQKGPKPQKMLETSYSHKNLLAAKFICWRPTNQNRRLSSRRVFLCPITGSSNPLKKIWHSSQYLGDRIRSLDWSNEEDSYTWTGRSPPTNRHHWISLADSVDWEHA